MFYRSLLFHGVLITAIASLPIVQSCGNKQDRARTESDRADTELGQAKNDRANAEQDLELDQVGAQALHYIGGYFATGKEIKQRGYYTTTEKLDRDRYVQNKLILKNGCVSKNNQAACSILSSLQEAEAQIEIIFQMDDLIGK
jgi:cob(I)alamin adenosyltransferase